MTQTVPDISPLMPMHQDPLLVYVTVHDILRYGSRPRGDTVRYGAHVDFLVINNNAFRPAVICLDVA